MSIIPRPTLPIEVIQPEIVYDAPASIVPAQAHSDDELIDLWLRTQSSDHTMQAYARDVEQFFDFCRKPLRAVTVGDLLTWGESLLHLTANSRKRKLSAIKSLLTFGQKLNYLQLNVGAAIKLPKPKNTIAERILSAEQVQQMIDLEEDTRNRVLLVILYATGGRVSEVCGLRWRDCQNQKKGEGQVTLYGKGGKTRTIKLSAGQFSQLLSLRSGAKPDAPVFVSKKGGPLQRSQVFVIVRAAARRAGIEEDVSPHWLRHAHGSHALDNGAPVHLVQRDLGHASLDTTTKYSHARPTDSSAMYLADVG